jgi:hypothetical protein
MRKMLVHVLSGNIPVLGLGSWIDSSPFLISFYETLSSNERKRQFLSKYCRDVLGQMVPYVTIEEIKGG